MTNLIVHKPSILADHDKMKTLMGSCASLAKIPFLKPELRGKPEAILAIVLLARELDVPEMTALSSFHFIKGTPTLPVSIMLALARTRVKSLKIRWEMDHENKTVECIASRDGCAEYSSYWDMPRAKQMGLTGRDQYIKQPLTMLKWRATADVLRVVCPEAIMGIYGLEEMRNLDGTDAENVIPTDKELLDEYHPIPEEEARCGNFYRIQNGKHRDMQLKDFSFEELQEYQAQLVKQINSKAARPWHDTLHSVISQYLMEFDDHRKVLPDIEYEE